MGRISHTNLKNRMVISGIATSKNHIELHVPVRVLIFDDPAENERVQRPGSESREGKLSNPGERAPRARCMNFFSKIYEIPRTTTARARCASSVPVKYTRVQYSSCSTPNF
jgi:hypothetical protein